ncbi:AI-2E family transporter [Weeksellaceae bacterium A-14]
MKDLKLPFLQKLALALISIVILGYIAVIGKTILSPLFFAFIMSLLFVQFANFLERYLRFSRAVSSLFSLLLMAAMMAGIIYFFTVQLSDFVNDFPQLQRQFTKTLHSLQLWISHTFNVNFAMQMDYLNQGLDKLVNSSGAIIGFTFSMFTSTGAFVVFSILFFIFILNYRRTFYSFIISVFEEKHSAKVQEIVSEIQRIIKQYIIGLFIQIIIVSILTSVLLTLLHVKYALLLGVLTGLLNVIPYIGIIFSCLIACLISFATGGDKTLFVLVGYVAIHAVDANITLPLVVGSKVKINAFFTFLGLLVGEAVWGISGMFLSIPFLAILKIIFERIDGLKPWGQLLGEGNTGRARKKYKITKNIILEEKE